jgi:hypothetical protein
MLDMWLVLWGLASAGLNAFLDSLGLQSFVPVTQLFSEPQQRW